MMRIYVDWNRKNLKKKQNEKSFEKESKVTK